MELLRPEALLLVPLFALALRRGLWPRPLLGVLRVAAFVCLCAVLAQPTIGTVADGRDVVFVVDRSRSMPPDHLAKAREFAAEVARAGLTGDRFGVVEFAREAKVAARLAPQLVWSEEERRLDLDGSDLGAALGAAVAMVPDGRNATILVWSDGEVPRERADALAQLAARRGVRVDVEPVARAFGRDAAVQELRLPDDVPQDAPFAVHATVVTTASCAAEWRLLVDGEPLRRGVTRLREGRNALQVPVVLDRPGEHLVALEVAAEGDVAPANDRGLAVVRVLAKTRVLCVTPAGRDDRLTRSLRAAGLDVVVSAPESAPLTFAALDGFRAVVLEDVPAGALPAGAMPVLRAWVQDLGGGLLMTGGRQSFGVGGYHRSPIEEVLPVTLEVRDEQRRFGLAMAIALDRSGSMGAEAGDATKMQLANRGAAGAVELLSAADAVAVVAVDTEPEVVLPVTAAIDDDAVLARIRAIEPGGGGIYVRVALEACAEQLAGAVQQAQHIVLFADASDAERPMDYRDYVPELRAAGVTVSVIGLGSATDGDADLLAEIARLGGGRCQFVADASELPRVFAQETIEVTQSAMVEEAAGVRVEPTLQLLGDLPDTAPPVGGYSVAWLRGRADRDMASTDEHAAPLLSHWQTGLGRAAAFLGEADGALSGDWAEWPAYGDLFGAVVRWLCGDAPDGVFVEARRERDVAVYSLEVDLEDAALLDDARGVATAPDGGRVALRFRRVGPGRVEARAPLVAEGVHRAAVQLGGEALRLPPLARPFSPEWELQPDPRFGEWTLRSLAARTGGFVAPVAAQVLDGPRRSRGRRDLGPWLVSAALLLLLAEIACRRLMVFVPAPRRRRAQEPSEAPVASPPPAAAPADDDEQAAPADNLLSALERAHRRGRRRR